MGSHHGGDVGWQSELRLVAMGPELLLQAVGSSLKVSFFAPFLTGPGPRAKMSRPGEFKRPKHERSMGHSEVNVRILEL